MRTIKGLAVPQDGNDVKFPSGQIRNETDVLQGTPVVREIYGDVLTNIYEILRDAGVTPNQLEDSTDTQYQLVDALKVFSNKLNDVRQVLTVVGLNINLLIDFDKLPSDYVFIGKTTDDLLSSNNYNINSSGNNSYPVILNSNILASSIVIVILNAAGSTIIDISAATGVEKTLHVPFGTPIASNSSSNLLYYSLGKIFTDFPKSFMVENKIQVLEGTLDIKIVDVILHKGKLICMTFHSTLLEYKLFSFDENDLDVLEGEIIIPNTAGVDNQPYMYSDKDFIYITNSNANLNNSVDDYSISKWSFNELNSTIAHVSSVNIDINFKKTTNLFITNSSMFTYINGNLYKYDISNTARVFIDSFDTINGVVFKFNDKTYYSNGNVATKWNY